MNKWLMWAMAIMLLTIFAIIALMVAFNDYCEPAVSVQPRIDPYERAIIAQAHEYHGILFSRGGDGELYFLRNGKKCRLISSIKKWRVIL